VLKLNDLIYLGASTSRENFKIQKLALDVFQLASASTLVLLVVRDAPASYSLA
jgi:hypothetical protein